MRPMGCLPVIAIGSQADMKFALYQQKRSE